MCTYARRVMMAQEFEGSEDLTLCQWESECVYALCVNIYNQGVSTAELELPLASPRWW